MNPHEFNNFATHEHIFFPLYYTQMFNTANRFSTKYLYKFYVRQLTIYSTYCLRLLKFRHSHTTHRVAHVAPLKYAKNTRSKNETKVRKPKSHTNRKRQTQ